MVTQDQASQYGVRGPTEFRHAVAMLHPGFRIVSDPANAAPPSGLNYSFVGHRAAARGMPDEHHGTVVHPLDGGHCPAADFSQIPAQHSAGPMVRGWRCAGRDQHHRTGMGRADNIQRRRDALVRGSG